MIKGTKHTKKSKTRISLQANKNWENLEYRKKIRHDGMLGKKHSIKSREKISNSNKKTWNKIETKRKVSGNNNQFYGKHHSKESLEKIRNTIFNQTTFEQRSKKAKKARMNVVLPKKDTSIEVKIQNYLKELKIDFFTHQHMNIKHNYQCDILIPYMNLVIECDGDYWHNYPVGRKIDHIRTFELLNNGFKVLRLWECEINEMTINKFREKIQSVEN